MSISGNLKGDGFLMGGTIVVSRGGTETLLQFKQDGPADHVENSAILQVSDDAGQSRDTEREGADQMGWLARGEGLRDSDVFSMKACSI